MRGSWLLAALLALGAPLPAVAQDTPAAEGTPPAATGVRLQGLDKITARIFDFDAPFGDTVRFGYLQIVARDCVASAQEDIPERSAFLEVVEQKPERDPVKVFSGWMFASSPSVSAMQHPVYDVWVVDCLLPGASEAVEGEGEAPATADEVEAPVEGVERPLD